MAANNVSVDVSNSSNENRLKTTGIASSSYPKQKKQQSQSRQRHVSRNRSHQGQAHQIPSTTNVYTYQGNTSTGVSHQKFLSRFGMIINSYYAKSLLVATIFLECINVSVVVNTFLIIKQNGNLELMEGDKDACLNFIYEITIPSIIGLSNFLLILPIFQIDSCRLYIQQSTPQGLTFYKTNFFKFSLCYIIMEIMFLLGYLIYSIILYMTIEEYKCFSQTKESYLFAISFGGSVLLYFCTWYQLIVFEKYRIHHGSQIGDKSDGLRLLEANTSPITQKLFSIFSKRQQHILSMKQKLYFAIYHEDLQTLQTELENGERIYGKNFMNDFYKSSYLMFGYFGISIHNPLHLACFKGYAQGVQLLLQAGCHIDHFDKLYPFSMTIENIYSIFMKLFMVNPWNKIKEKKDLYGITSMASQALLTPLHCAVGSDNYDIVKILINNKTNINQQAKSSNTNLCVPPIYMAQSPEIAELLIEGGANQLAVPPSSGVVHTVFEVAYQNAKYNLCRLLECYGGDFSLTPLHQATAANDVKKVISLLDWSALPDSLGEGVKGFHLRSPLHWASISGAVGGAMELLKRGANVNILDVNGMTPLHWASFHHHESVVRILLQSGADPNIRDFSDRTAMIIGCLREEKNQSSIFRHLVKAGADINAVSQPNYDTALHVALRRGHVKTSISLLRNGADITINNAEGKRPLDCTHSLEISFMVKKEAGIRDVMISYTHTHIEFVTKVKNSLEANKITVWMDTMSAAGIGGGSVWREEVARGIKNASVILCILSENYGNSKWCMKELALAKQFGIPILAISCDEIPLSEELQVYLYTRQIIPFENCIIKRDDLDPKHLHFHIDQNSFDIQLNHLLDGLRDEIEKRRVEYTSKQRLHELGHDNMSLVLGRLSDLEKDPLQQQQQQQQAMIFIAHDGKHQDFVNDLIIQLKSSGFTCYLDSQCNEIGQRIRMAKDAILQCAVFIPVISNETLQSEIFRDLLAFAEDKDLLNLQLLYNPLELIEGGVEFTLLDVKKYIHFTRKIGFHDSYNILEEHLAFLIPNFQSQIPLLDDLHKHRNVFNHSYNSSMMYIDNVPRRKSVVAMLESLSLRSRRYQSIQSSLNPPTTLFSSKNKNNTSNDLEIKQLQGQEDNGVVVNDEDVFSPYSSSTSSYTALKEEEEESNIKESEDDENLTFI